ncbi:MAG TPA: hypothetical protein VE133_11010, partial [Candidatus Sulfotelmatobacter sp.]|nr:hypothetical protein [Candidatus Sulfotelmatobacter sp.]
MNMIAVEQIAQAVLYEGYMLYPYRPSSVKNKQRWNFGVLYPQSYSEFQQGTDSCTSQTQVLVRGSVLPAIEIKIRFLHLVARSIGQFARPLAQLPEGQLDFETVPSLEIAGREYHPWQEAEEREISFRVQYGDSVAFGPQQSEYKISGGRHLEPIQNSNGQIAGVILREKQDLSVLVETSVERSRADVFKITLRTSNRTPFDAAERKSRD